MNCGFAQLRLWRSHYTLSSPSIRSVRTLTEVLVGWELIGEMQFSRVPNLRNEPRQWWDPESIRWVVKDQILSGNVSIREPWNSGGNSEPFAEMNGSSGLNRAEMRRLEGKRKLFKNIGYWIYRVVSRGDIMNGVRCSDTSDSDPSYLVQLFPDIHDWGNHAGHLGQSQQVESTMLTRGKRVTRRTRGIDSSPVFLGIVATTSCDSCESFLSIKFGSSVRHHNLGKSELSEMSSVGTNTGSRHNIYPL